MYLISSVPQISWQREKCADLLFIVTKPSTTKWAYTDSSTLTYTITTHTTGGYFAAQGDKPCITFLLSVVIHIYVYMHTYSKHTKLRSETNENTTSNNN